MKSRINVTAAEVKRELLSEQSPALLQELHLLTPQGSLNADARRKLKQVNHLVQLIAPALTDLASRFPEPLVVDVGAGKSYLGFILYELYLKKATGGKILSIENRSELVAKAQEMALRLGFSRMEFVESSIEHFVPPPRIHLLTALHACDTATDGALALGVNAQADYLAVVPCCQAEVAALLKGAPSAKTSKLSPVWRHGIHRREFGSHLTNVIRTLVLETLGYQVTVTELVGWEHSLKNEFIFAKKIQRENSRARAELRELLHEIQVTPLLVRLLLPEMSHDLH